MTAFITITTDATLLQNLVDQIKDELKKENKPEDTDIYLTIHSDGDITVTDNKTKGIPLPNSEVIKIVHQ